MKQPSYAVVRTEMIENLMGAIEQNNHAKITYATIQLIECLPGAGTHLSSIGTHFNEFAGAILDSAWTEGEFDRNLPASLAWLTDLARRSPGSLHRYAGTPAKHAAPLTSLVN